MEINLLPARWSLIDSGNFNGKKKERKDESC